jgi:hypothetical protein
MTPLPIVVVATTLAATAVFGLVLDLFRYSADCKSFSVGFVPVIAKVRP